MKQKQLDRLLDYRRRIEKERAVTLHEALVEQEKQEHRRDAALETRRRTEEKLRGFDRRIALELRQDHDSLTKASEVIGHIERKLDEANQRVNEETAALVEARREVKIVEILMERLAKREAAGLKRKEQQSNDEFVTREHFKKDN